MTSISNIWKQFTSILTNQNNFHSLEVVDRVSETQLQVGENSDEIILRLKGYYTIHWWTFSYSFNVVEIVRYAQGVGGTRLLIHMGNIYFDN